MDFFGLDIIGVLLVAGFVTFWGAVLILFVVFYDKNPYMPRKYYKVRLEDKDGNFLRYCKGWIVTTKKVKWLRIGLKDFPQFKGVELDISVLETINPDGEIEIIESVPSRYEAENYVPKHIPITQREAFILNERENVKEAVLMALTSSDLLVKAKDEQGNEKTVLNEQKFNEILIDAELKTKDNIAKNSRIVDLNTSKATKEYISQARREAERVKSDDFIYKYGPIISLIVACLFAYLIIDGSIKAFQTTMGQQNGVMENGYAQIVAKCGGVYQPINAPKNETPKQTGVQIPFINT